MLYLRATCVVLKGSLVPSQSNEMFWLEEGDVYILLPIPICVRMVLYMCSGIVSRAMKEKAMRVFGS